MSENEKIKEYILRMRKIPESSAFKNHGLDLDHKSYRDFNKEILVRALINIEDATMNRTFQLMGLNIDTSDDSADDKEHKRFYALNKILVLMDLDIVDKENCTLKLKNKEWSKE